MLYVMRGAFLEDFWKKAIMQKDSLGFGAARHEAVDPLALPLVR